MRFLCCLLFLALSSSAAETGGHALSFPKKGAPGFSLVLSETSGILFTNLLAESRSLTNQIYLNGSGVAAGDVDGDGLCDLYFCGLDNHNELYRNLGNWTFTNITASAGVACSDQASTGAALADIDGDGNLDLLVNGVAHGTRLFLNDGHGRFTEVTEQFGLRSRTGATSLALADIDGDGFLDLYVVNYRSSTFRDEPEKRFRVNNQNGRYDLISVDGRSATDPELLGRFTVSPITGLIENGEPDVLYRNRGGKRFEAVPWDDGAFLDENGKKMSPPFDWGLSAMFHDINGDGAPDLYVCNDFQSEDRLWINDGHGRFRLATAHALRHTSLFSMGVAFADLNGDGRDEIFVADMLSRDHARRQTQVMENSPTAILRGNPNEIPQFSRNTLFWNRGNGTFAEIAQLSGVAASEWSWCPAFLDVDFDGYPDLIVTAGHARDAQNIDVSREIEAARKQQNMSWRQQLEMRRRFPKLAFPLLGFRNQGDFTFAFAQAEWGFASPQVAQGMALADVDNDGDLDLIVNCLNGPVLLYRNNSAANRISVRLKGSFPNTAGIGARITVEAKGLPTQSEEITSGGRYLSSDDTTRSFAAGSAERLTIRVRWRNGKETILEQAVPNRTYFFNEETAITPPLVQTETAKPLFDDVSAGLNHRHEDQPFDDAQRQPLIPLKLSNLGPGLSWFDIDGDGWEDLIIGAGRTGRIALFKNEGGQFHSIQPEALCRPGTRDRTTILGWQHGTNRSLLIGSANYEDGLTNGPAARQFHLNTGLMDDSFPGAVSSTGPLALGDPDGDGNLDLFVGARVSAARYPEPASSRFLQNQNGQLVFDAVRSRPFADVGLVSGAVWSDLDGDGHPELLLACELGPIRVFQFTNNNFIEISGRLGLTNFIGGWNSVTTGDFDNDGRMDIVAGNWGQNTSYNEVPPENWRFSFAPAENGSSVQLIEAYYNVQLKRIVPRDSLASLSQLFPNLLQRYPTFASFGAASLGEIFGDQLAHFRELRVTTFDSMLFLNRGANFIATPLPFAAQSSPVFGLAVGDVNADGNEDLFLAQNFYGFKQDRCDAGSGLLLLGNGRGEFTPCSSLQSGITVDGEGRAAAFCDYDHDGRLDLAVGQNSGPTRLFHNRAPQRGLRILLKGSEQNPHGIGASFRLCYADGTFGPRHEVHAGEGYWSQAAATVILTPAKTPSALEMTTPLGKISVVPILPSDREIPVKISL